LNAWAANDFDAIVALAREADFFQDIPFSCPNTYKPLAAAFPGAKFILSTRATADQWYESLVRYHTQIVGKDRLLSSRICGSFLIGTKAGFMMR